MVEEVARAHPCLRLYRVGMGFERAPLLLELRDELIEDRLHGGLVRLATFADVAELVRELLERNLGLRHNRLHLGVVLERAVEVDGVEDAEELLVGAGPVEVGAEAGRAAEHLLVEDPALDAAEEDEVNDVGHVDPRREEVDGDGHLRVLLVTEVADERARPVGRPGDLGDGVVADRAVGAPRTPP